MTKRDLAKRISVKLNKPYYEVEILLKGLFEVFQEALLEGDYIAITGVCKVRPVITPATTWRNPNTGELQHLPDRMKIKVIGYRSFEQELTKSFMGSGSPTPIADNTNSSVTEDIL